MMVKRSNTWYFAYGSNLLMPRLRKRVDNWMEFQKATLDGWKLVFNKPSFKWRVAANIRKCSNEKVFGAVYLLTNRQFEDLVHYEVGYKVTKLPRETIDFKSVESEISVKTFIYSPEAMVKQPHPKYLNFILDGLKQHGYEEKDLINIKQIANRGAN